ncbi:MAG: ImmA/IrrE family metallo-endopeptidase [Thermincolia bacterium]
MLIKDTKFSLEDTHLIEKMGSIVKYVLTKEAYESEVQALAHRAFVEHDKFPWAVVFRELVRANQVPNPVIKSLLNLFTSNDFEQSLGALNLLTAADVADKQLGIFSLLKDALIKTANLGQHILIRKSAFAYLIENTDYNSQLEILNLMKSEKELNELAEELEAYVKIPYKELFNHIADNNQTDQCYQQIKFFLENNNSLKAISRVTAVFFDVFNQYQNSPLCINRLFQLIRWLAPQKTNSEGVALFVNNVLDNKYILNLFVKDSQLMTTEVLRPIAVQAADASTRQWTRQIIKRISLSNEEIYAIAARGDFKNLHEKTLAQIFAKYREAKEEDFNYDVLLPEFESNSDLEFKAGIVRNNTDEKEMPINLASIAQKYGIKLIKIEDSYSSKFDGCLFRAPDLPFPLIVYNVAGRNLERQRFTIGHELAHYILMHSYQTYCCSANEWLWGQVTIKETERAADSFSAALLMPLQHIIDDVKYGIESWQRISELAQKYKVSLTAVACRLVMANQLASAVIRIEGGKITLSQGSRAFPFPYNSLPQYGSPCPLGTGAHDILKNKVLKFEGELPLHRWLNIDREKGYKLKEHSILVGHQILTLLEIEDSAYYSSNDNDEELHHDYVDRHKKGFSFRSFKNRRQK